MRCQTLFVLFLFTVQASFAQFDGIMGADVDTGYASSLTNSEVIYNLKHTEKKLRQDFAGTLQELSSGPSSGSYGIFVIEIRSGEIVAAPRPGKAKAPEYLSPANINGKVFGSKFFSQVQAGSSNSVGKDLFSGTGSDSSQAGSYFVLVANGLKEGDYLLAAGANDWGMERLFVESVLHDAVTMLNLRGLEGLRQHAGNSWMYDYLNSYLYVLDQSGKVVFNTGTYQPQDPSNYEAHVAKFIYGLIGKALNSDGDIWVYGYWGGDDDTGSGTAAPKWYVACKAQYQGKTYILTTGVDADKTVPVPGKDQALEMNADQ